MYTTCLLGWIRLWNGREGCTEVEGWASVGCHQDKADEGSAAPGWKKKKAERTTPEVVKFAQEACPFAQGVPFANAR